MSGRARQLNHRLKNRKAAIISRREAEDGRNGPVRSESPAAFAELASGTSAKTNGIPATSRSPPMGFTAVNTRQSAPAEPSCETPAKSSANSGNPLFSQANTENVTVLNGASIKGISQEQRVELIKSFLVNADIQARDDDLNRRSPYGITRSATLQNSQQPRSESLGHGSNYPTNNSTAVPIPSTPASLLPRFKPTQVERDDGGPYKAEMVNRMESLHRGERIIPPCDRCRRLHMDCLKNLTACMGCTKKHAKCSWKDVREEELQANRSDTRTASYSPEHDDSNNHDMDPDHVEQATPDASASSRLSPISGAQQPAVQERQSSMSMRRELDLLPPPSSLATALTTSAASPSIYASVEKRSEVLPSPTPTTTITQSAPRTLTPDHSMSITTTMPTSTSAPTISIGQQLQDAANGLAAAHRSVFSPNLPQLQLQHQQKQAQRTIGLGERLE